MQTLPPIQINGVKELRSIAITHTILKTIKFPIIIENPNKAAAVHLDFSKNAIVTISSDVVRTSIANGFCIESIDLSDNHINLRPPYEDFRIFQWIKDVKELSLSRNNIDLLPHGCFDGLEKVEKILLDGNRIASIESGFLNMLSSIKSIDLSGNNLQEIPFSIKGMFNLSELDLSGNKLVFFTNEFLDELDQAASSHTFSLALKDNPIDCCSCLCLPFLEWSLYTQVKLESSCYCKQ